MAEYPCKLCPKVMASPGALGGHMSWHSRRGDIASEIQFDPAGLDTMGGSGPRAGVPTMNLLERRDPRQGLRLEKEVGWGGLVFVAVILAALLTLLVWGLFT